MPVRITTTDNHTHSLRGEELSGRDDLLSIAGVRIASLVNEHEGLLIFPDSLYEYGDDIAKQTIIHFEGESKVVTGNLMGFLGSGDTMLKIGSRFDRNGKDFFLQYMLQKVFSVNMFDMDYNSSMDSLFDFLLFLFPYYLKKAFSQGLYKEYRTFKRNDSKLKGVLDSGRHIRLNYPPTGNIAYNSREYSYDNPLTELFRHTIDLIETTTYGQAILSCDGDTKDAVRIVKEQTPSFNRNARRSVMGKNMRPKPSPYYYEYEPLRKLCMRILSHEEIKYGKDEDKVYGVLFDGAWLWEEYLNLVIGPLGITHPRNKTGENPIYLFRDPRSAPRYPDFIGQDVIIDAKYKHYERISPGEIGREDLSQMISYLYVTKAHHAVILCPGGEEVRAVSSHLDGYGGMVSIVNLPIENKDSFSPFAISMTQNEEKFILAIRDLPIFPWRE